MDPNTPDTATTSTTGAAPMNDEPDGPQKRAESGEHGAAVDADPDDVQAHPPHSSD